MSSVRCALPVAAVLVLGCNPFPALDVFVGAADATNAATAPSANDASPDDAGERDGSAPCPTGSVISALDAYAASPAGVDGPATCNEASALVADGNAAGLDARNDTYGKIDGKTVKGCVGVEFGASISGVIVRAHAVPNACGFSACGTTTTGCESGHTMSVFGGPSRSDLHKLEIDVDINDTLEDHAITLPTTTPTVRVVVVCRNTWGADRDDVAVDWIGGRCP